MKEPKPRILVVDDERNIRRNLDMVLEAEGYQVDTASDGDEALAKCKEQHFDMAFVDIQMPKMGGLELLRYLRGLRPKMAVVVLTAYGTVARAVEAMKLGAADFLEKPFEPKAIVLLCAEILQRDKLGASGSTDELLQLAQLARERKAHVEARRYLKTAMLRDVMRPEPYYWLGYLCETEGDKRAALTYYYMAVDANRSYEPALEALKRLGQILSS